MRVLILAFLVAIPLAGGRAQTVDDGTPLRLRAGDAVRLQVGGEPGFGCLPPRTGFEGQDVQVVSDRLLCDYDVDEEGTVLLPLIGIVRVAGVPFAEVRQRIRSAYADEFLDPAVAVTPLLRIAVLGEVRRPGLFRVDPTYTLADVLASAGGLTPEADVDDVRLVRDGSAVPVALDGTRGAGAPRLLPGDQVVVGRRSWLSRNVGSVLSVTGSVLAAVVTSLILR